MKNFKHKKIIISGAGSGMGRYLSYQLAAEGAEVFITDINGQTLSETQQEIIAKGGKCKTYVVDSGSEQQIYAFKEKYLTEEKYVDVLFNNAGMALGEIEFLEVKEDHLKKIIDVNMWGVIHFTRAFLPTLISRPEAHLINTSSVFGIIGVETQVPYCTTKFAVRGFTEALRMELSNTNVVVSCVHPGGIKTNIARNGIHYKNAEKSHAQFDEVAITTAEDAARIIINGVKKNKKKILVGVDAKLIDIVARLFPVKYSSLFKRLHEKYFKK
jgi:short-subunit dehydrogenase